MRLSLRSTRTYLPIILGVSACLAVVYQVATKRFVFGSPEGGWVYPYISSFTKKPILTFFLVLPNVLGLTYLTARAIDKYERVSLFAWFVAGFFLQLVLRCPHPYTLGTIIRSHTTTSFYSAALHHTPLAFMREFHSIAPTIPVHGVTNMPGKVMLFFLLGVFTSSPQVMGYLIVAISNLGGLLLYWIVKDLFGDKRTALYALIFYLFVPAKLFFFPSLNTVSPVLILLCFFVYIRFLRSGRFFYPVLLGLSLYLTLFFDPIPLVVGLVFIAFLWRALQSGQVGLPSLGKLFLYCVAAFVLADDLMMLVFRYDIFSNFLDILDNAYSFYARTGHSYEIWIRQNVVEFLFGTGVCQSLLFFVVILTGLRARTGGDPDRANHLSDRLIHPAMLMALSLLAVLVFVDLAGATRGEVVRLWIFLSALFQIVPAYYCARAPGIAPFCAVLAATLLQDAVAISMVGFMLP